jgi:hypothetical protein
MMATASISGKHVLNEHRQRVTAVGVMAYARVAGYVSPAGVETANSGVNPALSHNCDAPSSGMSQVDRFAPNGRQPSDEGRFVRQPPPGVFLRRRGGFHKRTHNPVAATFAAGRSRCARRSAATHVFRALLERRQGLGAGPLDVAPGIRRTRGGKRLTSFDQYIRTNVRMFV